MYPCPLVRLPHETPSTRAVLYHIPVYYCARRHDGLKLQLTCTCTYILSCCSIFYSSEGVRKTAGCAQEICTSLLPQKKWYWGQATPVARTRKAIGTVWYAMMLWYSSHVAGGTVNNGAGYLGRFRSWPSPTRLALLGSPSPAAVTSGKNPT